MPETKHFVYPPTGVEHYGEVIDTKEGFDVIECETCGFKHVIPIPTPDELEKLYKEEFYSTEKPKYLERHREDQKWWNLVYQDRYDVFEENIPNECRSILDIGSGPGFFLLEGKKRGWKTLGIEPSKQAVENSKSLGLDIIEDLFSPSLANESGKFDVVHMNNVLEHIPDPRSILKAIYNLIKHGGLLCVSVPNDYNPFQQVLREVCNYEPYWVAPPEHINYFNVESLERLFKKMGFEVILKEATFPIDLFLLMGDNYIGDDLTGRACHEKRKHFELALKKGKHNKLKRDLYGHFADLGVGRELTIYGRKPLQECGYNE